MALREAVVSDSEVPPEFAKVSAALLEEKGLVIFGWRIVVPAAERREVLERLHDAYLGEERTLRQARQAVYWPGMSADVKNKVRACCPCQELRPSHRPEKLLRDPMPQFAFQELAADYVEVQGKHFLVVADQWSGFPAVYPVQGHPNSAKTVTVRLHHFWCSSPAIH